MMDTVACLLLIIVPLLSWSLVRAKVRRDWAGHKRIQLGLSVVLVIVQTLFEVEVRTHDWRLEARSSPYYDTWLFPLLWVHVAVAATTALVWTGTLWTALRRFPRPPRPGRFSVVHRRLGWTAASCMYLTAVTGWAFFWMAFIAAS